MNMFFSLHCQFSHASRLLKFRLNDRAIRPREHTSTASLIRRFDATPFHPKFALKESRVASIDGLHQHIREQSSDGRSLTFQVQVMAALEDDDFASSLSSFPLQDGRLFGSDSQRPKPDRKRRLAR